MRINKIKYFSLAFFLLSIFSVQLQGEATRFRCMWRTSPATSMVVGWDQVSGSHAVLFYGTQDNGKDFSAYPNKQHVDIVNRAKGMNNHFVRLEQLQANTVYYFVIKDSEGVSRRMSFKTADDNPKTRLSIIAGGDSRNNRDARLRANKMVSKLRPDLILFSGDMTADDNDIQWQLWFDDWQLTIGNDGRMFPIIVARGNHEGTNIGLVDLFDVNAEKMYYSLTLGGNLLSLYTLNTLIPSGGNQKKWLESSLKKHRNVVWKIAQYHQAIKPHTDNKAEQNELLINWATLFHKYHVDIALESDAHVVKWTWPIRPSRDRGSEEGFIRDDEQGTVYLGEGGWGAPARINNDDKSWTRNSGSFNQFKWIFVDEYHIEVRTIHTDGVNGVQGLDDSNRFAIPYGLKIWSPSNGDVLTLVNRDASPPPPQEATGGYTESPIDRVPAEEKRETPREKVKKKIGKVVKWLSMDPATKTVKLRYTLNKRANVDIIIIDKNLKEVSRAKLPNQIAKSYLKSLSFAKIGRGGYLIVIKADGKVIQRYRVRKE